jgi:type II secretion system protein N
MARAWVRAPSFVLPPRAQQSARWLGYPLFYLLCLVVFAKLTFPYDRLKDKLVQAFDAQQTGPDPMRLEVGEMSSYWLTGIEADDIRLIRKNAAAKAAADKADSSGSSSSDDTRASPSASAAPAGSAEPEKKKKDEPGVTTIDSAHASVSVLRLLFGTVKVAFGADVADGDVSGTFIDTEEAREIALELDEVGVGGVPMLGDIVGLPMGGKVEGSVELVAPEQKLSKANGTIDLKIVDLTVGDGKAKIRNTIALPQLDAGELTLKAKITEGKLEIETFTVQGPDIELKAEGGMRLRDPFEMSLADVNLEFKFLDVYKNKNDLTRGLFGAPNSTVPGLFDLDGKNRQAKRPDGTYAWRISGAMGRLNFAPSSGATRTGSSRTGSAAGATP